MVGSLRSRLDCCSGAALKVLAFQPLKKWYTTFRNCKCGKERKGILLARINLLALFCFRCFWSLHILEVTTTTTSCSSSFSPMAWPKSSVTSINLRTVDRSNRGSAFCRSCHIGKSRSSSKRLKVLARLLKRGSIFSAHIFTIIIFQ